MRSDSNFGRPVRYEGMDLTPILFWTSYYCMTGHPGPRPHPRRRARRRARVHSFARGELGVSHGTHTASCVETTCLAVGQMTVVVGLTALVLLPGVLSASHPHPSPGVSLTAAPPGAAAALPFGDAAMGVKARATLVDRSSCCDRGIRHIFLAHRFLVCLPISRYLLAGHPRAEDGLHPHGVESRQPRHGDEHFYRERRSLMARL